MILLTGMDLDTTQTLLGLREARDRLCAAGTRLGAEDVAVGDAVGRVLAEPHRALVDLPGWDNSALDGFALRAAESDRELPIAFTVSAGDDPPPLPPGAAASIATGLGPCEDGREAGMTHRLVPGGQLAECARHGAGAGEPGDLHLRIGDRVHREVAGDSTDGRKRRRDPVTTREYVRLTAHDENLPRCIA